MPGAASVASSPFAAMVAIVAYRPLGPVALSAEMCPFEIGYFGLQLADVLVGSSQFGVLAAVAGR